jgi:hypothetical protein
MPMSFRQLGTALLLSLGIVAVHLSGCQYLPFGQKAESDLEDDVFGELSEGGAEEKSGDDRSAGPAAAEPVDLSLRLEVGQRFPLTKTVEQRITQSLPSGPMVSHSRLDLQLSLVVEEVQAARRRLSVRYHRVRYVQEVGGQIIEYHSDRPVTDIPPAALPYAGLKDNGFSFWIGADNQVQELIGFADFLRRCLHHVPLDQQPAVLRHLQDLGATDGLASFVDDSIGLLPGRGNGGEWRVGSTWELPRRAADGSAAATTRCLLKDLNERTAEISLLGSIGPSSYVDDVNGIQLTVLRGQTPGTCTVDRLTGMPTRSRVERTLDMTAQLADGSIIPQRKEMVSTVMAYLEQSAMHAVDRRAEGTGQTVHQSVYIPQGQPGPR